MRRLVPSHPSTKGSQPHATRPNAQEAWSELAQGSWPLAQVLHPHALGIYVVICHFTFKKVFRIDHTTIPNHQKARL